MIKITMTEIKQVKKEGTKTVWIEESKTVNEITQYVYSNITDENTIKWFRRLGGTETVNRGYTYSGYNIIELVSTSPDKQMRTIRKFNFDRVEA